jgi:uroporphyrinogen-III synthase
MNRAAASLPAPLTGCTVVCLRPAVQQAAVRAMVVRAGGAFVALPGMRLSAMQDAEQAEQDLRAALRSKAAIFTSPAAVQFAAKLLPLDRGMPSLVFAVGEGTARALRRHGITAIAPTGSNMQGEGVLALPQVLALRESAGIVTAPGGRESIAPELQRRGLTVRIAHVYRRLPPKPQPRSLQALRQSPPPRAVLISSGEAIENLARALEPADFAPLREAIAVVSSARLEALARELGFTRVLRAQNPSPKVMLETLAIAIGN